MLSIDETGPCGITAPAESTSSIDVKRSSGRSENHSDSETGGDEITAFTAGDAANQPRVRKKKRRRDEDRQRDARNGCIESNACIHGYRLVAMRRQRKLVDRPSIARRLRSPASCLVPRETRATSRGAGPVARTRCSCRS